MALRRALPALAVLALAAAAALAAGPAAADTIKVGIIGTFSGPFALQGKNFKLGIETYQAMHGKTAGGHDVQFVYRDVQTPDPTRAKAVAQELIVKEQVQYLGGIFFTPNALAVAPLLEEGKVPLVVFNAATSSIVQRSPYIVRTSFTLPQTTAPMARVAAKRGMKKVVTAVSDYGPGLDAETTFKKTFEAEGGSVPETLRMPVNTTDFGPVMQRIKDSGAEAVFAFLPAGPPTLAFVKSFIDNGLRDKGLKLITTGDLTQETALQALGDASLGILSTFHYSFAHDSDTNRQFLEKLRAIAGSLDEVTFPVVGAYDGMHVIYKMIEATGGKRDPKKAVDSVKGLQWESPRGPLKIDPETRNPIQNIYLRVVEKQDGRYINKEIETFPNQGDPGLEQK